jgi:hypothetical protein
MMPRHSSPGIGLVSVRLEEFPALGRHTSRKRR